MKSNILFLVIFFSVGLCFAQQKCNHHIVEKKLYFYDTLCIVGNDTFDYSLTPLFYDTMLLEDIEAFRFVAQEQTLTYMAMDEKNFRFNTPDGCMRVIIQEIADPNIGYKIFRLDAMSDTLIIKEGIDVYHPLEINDTIDYTYTIYSINLPHKVKQKIWSLANTIVHNPKDACMRPLVSYFVELCKGKEYYSLVTDGDLYCFDEQDTTKQEKWRYKNQNKYLIRLKNTLLKIRSKCEDS